MSISGVLTRGYGGTGHRSQGLPRRGYAAYTGLPDPPIAGYEYLTSTSLYSGSGYSLEQGSNPAVIVGDVFITQTVSSPSSYTILINGDGTIELFSAGDTSRQSFLYEIYRVASNTIDGPATVWINEVAPSWGRVIFINNQVINTALTPLSLVGAPYATSASGDTLVFSLSSGSLPLGVTLSSAGIISGTPTVIGTYTFTISALDYANESTASPSSQIVVIAQIVPPSGPIPPNPFIQTISAWTTDAVNVTADSINYTCDGADLINGGGFSEAETTGPARNVSQYLRF